MENSRHRPRKNTPHVVKAYDNTNGDFIGRVVDITADGMMIVTRDLVTTGREFQLRIILPVMVQHKTDVVVNGQVVWSEPDTNPDYCRIGIKFSNLDGADGYLLEDVMHRLNLVG